MALLHEYENRLIRQLPPNAQHVAEMLLSRLSLTDMLRMRDNGDMDLLLLNQHKVDKDIWPEILRAVILAKVTYFDPTEFLDQAKVLLLVKLAVEAAGFSLSTPLPQVVAAVKTDYPRLTRWLVMMAQLLGKLRTSNTK
jgi:hypothetical protein